MRGARIGPNSVVDHDPDALDAFLLMTEVLIEQLGQPKYETPYSESELMSFDDWVDAQAFPDEFLTWMKGRLLDYKREHYGNK